MAELPATTVQKPAGNTRIHALDSLRGLAALVVVFHHIDNTLDLDGSNPTLGPIFHQSPLRLLVDGRCAVMLFFVLSGFALSISIGRTFNYWNYLIKRICRLMIPCVAGVLLAAALYLLIMPKPIPELGDWFNNVLWNAPVTWTLVARHILMTGIQVDTSLVNVIWSLVIELRISLVFPFLYFIFRRRLTLSLITAVAMEILFRYLVKMSGNFVPFFNKNITEALENIGYYVPFFILGIIARDNIEKIKGFVARQRKWVVVVSSIVLLLGALKLEESGEDMQIGIGAFIIIVVCVSVPFISDALSVRPIEWLGRVSYSLYLIHLTVLATFFHLFYGKINNLQISALVVFGSLVFAHIVYRLVEAPSIELGKWLTRKKTVAVPVTS